MMASWKTTLIGALGAVGTVLLPMVQTGLQSVSWGTVASACALALLGFFSKDKNVTGVQ